jgi:DNA-binding XRE family transcriptional regulator
LTTLKLEPVAPSGQTTVLVLCPCGGRFAGCPGMRTVQLPIPPAEAATAGMQFRQHRFALGLPKAVAANRLGISYEQLVELERGASRCDWVAARAALVWKGRAEA